MGVREGDRELDELLLRAVERAGQPVRLVKLVAALPKGYQKPPGRVGERVAALARDGRLYVWTGRPERIALETRDAWIRSRILQLLHASGPLTGAELGKRLGADLARDRGPVLAALCAEGLVRRHPRLGQRSPYALVPPDPVAYLRPGLEALMRSLERRGFSRAELWKALARLAPPPPAPEPSTLILECLRNRDPEAARGALVPLAELRRGTAHAIGSAAFDSALLGLARAGRVQLRSHALPAELTEEEKPLLVPDGRGSFYVEVGLLGA